MRFFTIFIYILPRGTAPEWNVTQYWKKSDFKRDNMDSIVHFGFLNHNIDKVDWSVVQYKKNI